MTRFARGKGSKASNEKVPEDSTPWEIMKEQLIQSKMQNDETKKREEVEQQRIDNYNKFLMERKVQKRKSTWCEFGDSNPTLKEVRKDETQNVDYMGAKSKKIKKSLQSDTQNEDNLKVNEHSTNCEESMKVTNKKNKKHLVKPENEKAHVTSDKYNNQHPTQESSDPPIYNLENIAKRKKNKKKFKKTYQNDVSEPDIPTPNFTDVSTKKIKNKGSNKDQHDESNLEINHEEIKESNKNIRMRCKKEVKNKKAYDGKSTRRKAINDRSFELIVNGKKIELIRFDGFPIMKKDAERLGELRNDMMKKGIPKSEIQRTMKLERRRAEKALARLKRDVCYNCRKGGHNLSDCPDLKSKVSGLDAAEGVCFKCGSTEHRQFECKVQKDKEFRFATCFICKEPGHIARQCPDNPKGLYPNGGSCKLCGDVTHLRKDCPTVKDQKEGSSIKLKTLADSGDIEDVEQVKKTNGINSLSKKPKKIKFL